MSEKYLQFPLTIKDLSLELRVICDDYVARKISNDELKELIKWHVDNNADKLFTDEKINITVEILIGKKRLNLINRVLKDIGE